MALLLTTAVSPGDLEGFDYDRVKIVDFQLKTEAKYIRFVVEYGTIQDSKWVAGMFQPVGFPKDYAIRDMIGQVDGAGDPIPDVTDFTDMVASLPTDGAELLYDGVARVLYQWLIDNGHFAGTIE